MGFCVTALPEAIGTNERPATRLERYRSLALSFDCIWRTLSCHDRVVLGLNGEQGLFTWMIWRVEPSSGRLQVGMVRPLAKEKKRMAREKYIILIVGVRELLLVVWGLMSEFWLSVYL